MADNPSDTTDESSAAETTASSTYKVLGELPDAGGIGVLGRNTAGSGATYGVKGAVDSPDGYGVYTPDDAKVDGTLVVPALGTLTQDDLLLLVNDLVALRIEPGDGDYGPNAVLGNASNAVGDGARAASIGGGGYEATSDYGNKVSDDFGTVGGGINNQAGDGDGDGTSAMNATVAGGNNNTASGSQSAVGGGAYNEATEYASAVAGGSSNESRESYGAIGGGK